MLGVVLIALLLAGASAGSTLQEILSDEVQQYGDIEELKAQLHLILEESRTLVENGAPLKHRRLRGEEPDFTFEDLYNSISKTLKPVESVANKHPVLPIISRRTYLATVALHWILSGRKALDVTLEQKLAEVVGQFYRMHVASVLRKGLLEYLHISKSGGTSFSAAAKHSKCSMARGIGQLEELGDVARWINGSAFEEITGGTDIMWSFYSTTGRPAKGRDCSRRLSHLSAEGYSYVSNEFTLHGGATNMHATHICPQAVNVVTLRNPDARLASHLHYMLARMKKRLLGNHGAEPDSFEVFCSGTLAVWDRIAPTVVDNYGVRSFVGERAFHSPVGSIGKEHVEVARRLLLQFDLVLDLEAGEAAADLAIQQGLGWDVTMSELHVRTSSQTFSKLNYSKEECPNENLLRKLLPRQEPDRMLYSTGRTLAMLDGMFLGVARGLGLEPEAVAADILDGSDALGGNAKSPKAGKDRKTGEGAPTCGLLRTAPGWQPDPADAATDAVADAIAASAAATAAAAAAAPARRNSRAQRDARVYSSRRLWDTEAGHSAGVR